jgi:dTDP-glucose pyrophosphorylase
MRKFQIIMPMAGEGSRFQRTGINLPKPLLTIDNQPFFVKSLSGFKDIRLDTTHSFIIREEHDSDLKFSGIIRHYFPESNIFRIEKATRGAVETCMVAKEVIDDNGAVLILDCDLYVYSRQFHELIEDICNSNFHEIDGGVLVSFKSSDKKYSYAETTGEGRVIRTAEKEVISENALIGAYFFSNGAEFKATASKMIHTNSLSHGEYYVSNLFNYLIRENKFVKLISADIYRSFGTPEELNALNSEN